MKHRRLLAAAVLVLCLTPTLPAQTTTNLFSQTTAVTVANTTTETTIIGAGQGSVTIPAVSIAPGSTFRLTAYGFSTSAPASTLTFRVKLNNATIGTLTTGNLSSNQLAQLDFVFTVYTTGGITSTLWAQGLVIPS